MKKQIVKLCALFAVLLVVVGVGVFTNYPNGIAQADTTETTGTDIYTDTNIDTTDMDTGTDTGYVDTSSGVWVDAYAYVDNCAVLHKEYSAITATDKTALEQELTAYANFSDDMKEAVDSIVWSQWDYENFESCISDRIAKSDFEGLRETAVLDLSTILRGCDGETFRNTVRVLLETVQGIVYDATLDDATRQSYFAEKQGELQAYKTEITRGRALQRAENKIRLLLQEKQADGKYSSSELQEITRIAEAGLLELKSLETETLESFSATVCAQMNAV